nr:protein DpdE [Nocardiopsis sinuspersici]
MVTYPGSPGVGRVGSFDAQHVRVDFFESVAEPVAHSVWVEVARCKHVRLEAETRVYRRNPDTGVWLAGRVRDKQGDEYFVRFPNTEYDFPIPEPELHVRWDRPVQAPVTVLTSGGSESAYRDARMGMLHDLIGQRAASASIFSFLSSAVELYPHQVHAALTVLSDPVQRYLLADEVGLGKTIEAGFVIRQVLIDDPEAKITILAPDVLRHQWIRELTEKFFIDDFPKARVRVSAHESPERWERHHGCDLVVVDEAHRLVQVQGPEETPYRELCALAHSTPRVLLLSATPVTSHYTTHLGLLHLLDPTLYRWTDRESFEHRYKLRARLADSVYGLDADYTYLLPSSIEEVRDQLPKEDHQFEWLSAQILELLDEEDELRVDAEHSELVSRVEALRGHISEVYRLHRRVIRHRRDKVLRDDPDSGLMPYEVRGRRSPEPLLLESTSHAAIEEALFEWQSRVWDHLLDTGQEERKPEYARALAILVARGGAVGNDLLNALRWRLHGDIESAEAAGLDTKERAALAAPPVLPVEGAILRELEERTTGDEECKTALNALVGAMLPVLRNSKRTVVFCGAGTLAADLAARMQSRFAKANIGEHTRRLPPEVLEAAVSTWLSPGEGNGGKAVLIVDDSGEDGLNLQAADAVIHVRSPWSPNQFEQRLGRVDRYRGAESLEQDKPARQYRIRGVNTEESFLDSWADLLEKGYRIFSESVSALQDAIAQGITRTWESGLEDGPAGLTTSADQVRTDLDTARGEIDKMDMLESIHMATIEDHDIAQALGEFEARWKETREVMLNYTSGMGGIKLRHYDRQVKGCAVEVFDIANARPLVDPRLWAKGTEHLTSDSTRAGFNRSAVLKAPGTRLFRRGNPLVDVLSSAIAIDDRGQAAAFRRIDRSMKEGEEPVPYFGFDYLVEANIEDALALVTDRPEAENALRRQADRIFPPFMLKVWVQAGSITPITAPQPYRWLNRPYTKQPSQRQPGDQNYNFTRTAELLQVFGGWNTYRKAAESAQQVSRERLSEATDLDQKCAQAQEEARRRIAVSKAQAQARQAAGHLVGDAENSFLDVNVTDLLIEGLFHPVVRVVAATCIVRSGLERVRRDA